MRQLSIPTGTALLAQLRRTQLSVRNRLDSELAGSGLTTPQFGVLSLLRAQGELSASDLARELGVTAQTMNVLATGLTGRGLVERRRHPGHGRILLLGATADGLEALERAIGSARRLEKRLLSAIPVSDRRRLIHNLRTLEITALESS